MNELLIRLGLTIAIITLALGLAFGINRLILVRNRNRSAKLAGFHKGKPAILYFTTPDCAPCKTIQGPAIQQVRSRLGDGLQVIVINAYDEPGLAGKWGVLSVPTTFIIDPDGHKHFVNHGVTPAKKLMEQLDYQI